MRQNKLISIAVMVVIEGIWGFMWQYWNGLKEIFPGNNNDILYYVSSVFLALLTFIVFSFLNINVGKKDFLSLQEDTLRENVLEGVTYFVLICMLICFFLLEEYMPYGTVWWMPGHSSKAIEVLFIVVLLLIFWQVRMFLMKGKESSGQRTLFPFYIILSLIVGYAIYQPNCFVTDVELHHAHAYFNSIYRVLHLQPFTEINCGMYGFYGLIIAPIMKIFWGGSFSVCVLILSIIGTVSIACFYYVLNYMVKSVELKIIAGIGIVTYITSVSGSSYFQTIPHRFFFPALMLAYIVKEQKSNKAGSRRCLIIGEAISAVSIVWNLETGMACTLAYVGAFLFSQLQQYKITSFIFWKKVLFGIVFAILAFFGAFTLVGIYDMIVSGEWITLKAFLFPYVGASGTGQSYINMLHVRLGPSAWIGYFLLFMVAFGIILFRTTLFGYYGKDDKLICLAACTITVTVQMTYYMNRSVWGNLGIVFSISSIIMAFLVEYMGSRHIWTEHQLGNGAAKALSVGLASVLLITGIMTIGKYFRFEEERETKRDMGNVNYFIEFVSIHIPKDTLGIGRGIPEIYSYLGWDTGYYGIDISDFPVAPDATKENMFNMLFNAGNIFLNNEVLEIVNGDSRLDSFYQSHDLEYHYKFGDLDYYYYGKK